MEMVCDDVKWIELTRNGFQWRHFVIMANYFLLS